MFQRYVQRVMGHGPSAGGRGTASRGLAYGAHGVPRVLRMGHAHPDPGSWVLPARREEGVRGKEWWA